LLVFPEHAHNGEHPGLESFAKQSNRRLASLIFQARYVLALTGPSISIMNKSPFVHGRRGIYETLGARQFFNLEQFLRDPSFFYTISKDLIYNLEEAQPTIVHKLLASLESRGLVQKIITQNIDRLHQKAGSHKVLEINGSPQWHDCLDCDFHMPYAEAAHLVHQNILPRCKKCSRILKPRITFYGEALPWEIREQISSEVRKADLIIAFGARLFVPFLEKALQEAHTLGSKLIVVDDIPGTLDHLAHYKFSGLEPTCSGLFELIA